MDQSMARKLLMNEYHSYSAILHERGISYEIPSDEEVAKLNDSDFGNLVRRLRDLARTPGVGR